MDTVEILPWYQLPKNPFRLCFSSLLPEQSKYYMQSTVKDDELLLRDYSGFIPVQDLAWGSCGPLRFCWTGMCCGVIAAVGVFTGEWAGFPRDTVEPVLGLAEGAAGKETPGRKKYINKHKNEENGTKLCTNCHIVKITQWLHG